MIEIEEDEAPSGSPAWMATFADLMSLLMCFFVLLLSFSEMDVLKYKQVAGSMKDAFGVQNKIKVKDIPKGTSIIAKEFSPGDPTPTQIKTINQITTDITQRSLKVGNPNAPASNTKNVKVINIKKPQTKKLLEERFKSLVAKTEADAEKLKKILKKEIESGKIDIETEGRSIIIRIRERGSFPSASATLHHDFIPVIATLRTALKDIPGKIAVEGHSDNIPINRGAFKSNWDLSASRALTVTHELIQKNILDDNRFMVIGLADTQPREPNTNAQNRAQNRRVEIIIRQGLDEVTTTSLEDIQKSGNEDTQEPDTENIPQQPNTDDIQESNPEVLNTMGINDEDLTNSLEG
jgi:chemotaxis protein MotB